MAEKKYYWLKLQNNFFEKDEIKVIESRPNGEKHINFYLKLLLKSVSTEGKLLFRDVIPYTPEMLASITNTDVDTVRVAIDLFLKLGLMEQMDDGALFMSETQNMIGSESKWAQYKRNKKLTAEDLPQLTNCKRLSCEQIRLPDGQTKFVDEKRYGGNGGLAYDRANGRCEQCGTTENLCLHHDNEFSNELADIKVLCRKCHSRLEKVQSSSKTVPIETETEQETEIETELEQQHTEIEKILKNNFDNEEIETITKYCIENNVVVKVIVEKIEIINHMKKIRNKVGALLTAIKEDWKPSKSQSNYVSVPGFNNFEPREYDYDDLERKLLGWDNEN